MSGVSRRDLFRALLGQSRPAIKADEKTPALEEEQLALILDRFCLAHQGSFCTVCSEHCPEEGAIQVTQGKPTVVPDLCTGCRKCHDVCPAPKNAIFLVAKAPRQGMIGRTVEETQPQDD